MIDPEELERCKDPRYFYNNYWRINGRPVEPVSEHEWKTMMEYHPTFHQQRGRLFGQNQACAQSIARVISAGKTSLLLMLKEDIDNPVILILKKIMGEENLIITPQYASCPPKREYLLPEEEVYAFAGYRIELKTNQ